MTEVDDDASLIERARRGDEQAFSQLFARYQGPICRYASFMCGPQASDDVVQDTFMVLLRQKERQDTPRGAGGYLFGIARHLVMKRLAQKQHLPLDERRDHVLDGVDAIDTTTALDDLTRAETVDAIRRAVQSLPPPFRETVVLCDLQEMDYASVADLMECPVGTVRSRLNRGRALLLKQLIAIAPASRVRRG